MAQESKVRLTTGLRIIHQNTAWKERFAKWGPWISIASWLLLIAMLTYSAFPEIDDELLTVLVFAPQCAPAALSVIGSLGINGDGVDSAFRRM